MTIKSIINSPALKISVIFPFAIYYPLLGILLFCIMSGLLFRSKFFPLILTGSYIIFIFGYMNMNKVPLGDWIWYSAHYKFINDTSISYYFLTADSDTDLYKILMGVRPRLTEPLFYFFALVVGQVSGGALWALSWTITVVVYFQIILVSFLLTLYLNPNSKLIPLIIFSSCMLGTSFPLVTHLVRQELAMSFLLTATFCLVTGKRNLYILFLVAAVLSHNSVVIPAALITIAYWAAIDDRYFKLAFVLILAVGSGLFVSRSEAVDQFTNDGQISIAVFVLDAVIAITIFIIHKSNSSHSYFSRFLIYFYLVYISFYLFSMSNSILALRMYFFMDVWRVMSIVIISNKFKFVFGRTINSTFIFILSLFYCQMRIYTSPFDFGGDLFSYIMNPIVSY